ncbi:MAG TPA: response regulator [Gaiellales bacterium]|nr:response regulator [Gaiellales bacterium]
MRVLICDDSLPLRRELRIGLEAEGFEVVGEAGDGVEAVELADRLEPDACVVDLSMPRRDGLEVVALLRERLPGARIVVFSAFAADRMRDQALRRGADAYLEKGCAFPVLVDALAHGRRERTPEGRVTRIDIRPHGVLDAIVEVYERELTRAAEALHDGPVQVLTAATLQLRLAVRHPERAAEAAEDVARQLDEASADLRDLMAGLATWNLAGSSFGEAVRSLVESKCRPFGVEAEVAVNGEVERIPAGQCAAALRTVQEAVANAIRHSGASRIEVSAAAADRRLEVRVADDGDGFDLDGRPAADQLGIPLMRRRVESLGGRIEITSAPGRGTEVVAVLPLAA